MRATPEAATFSRMLPSAEQDRLDGQLNEIGDEAEHTRISRAKDGLASLRKFDRAKLSAEQKLSYDMLEYELNDVVAEEPYLLYTFPLNRFRGVQVGFPGLMTDVHPLRNQKDAENYLARLRAFGPKLDQALGMMQDRARQGIRLPGFISAETIAQMKRFTAPEPAQNVLVTSLAARLPKLQSLAPAQQAGMLADAEKIVRESIYPAYRRAADGLATVNANAPNDAGLWRLPKGAEAYAFFLRRFTTTSPDLRSDSPEGSGRSGSNRSGDGQTVPEDRLSDRVHRRSLSEAGR